MRYGQDIWHTFKVPGVVCYTRFSSAKVYTHPFVPTSPYDVSYPGRNCLDTVSLGLRKCVPNRTTEREHVSRAHSVPTRTFILPGRVDASEEKRNGIHGQRGRHGRG